MQCKYCSKHLFELPFLCEEGHTVCNKCVNLILYTNPKKDIAKCPVRLILDTNPGVTKDLFNMCAAELHKHSSKSIIYFLNNRELTCPYYECNQVTPVKDMQHHMEQCAQRKISIDCFLKQCCITKVFHINDYFKHLTTEHGVPVNNATQYEIKIDYPMTNTYTDSVVFPIFNCHDQTFLIIKQESDSKLIFFPYVMSKDKEIAKNYQLVLTIKWQEYLLHHQADVFPIGTSVENMILSGHFITIMKKPIHETILRKCAFGLRTYWPLTIEIKIRNLQHTNKKQHKIIEDDESIYIPPPLRKKGRASHLSSTNSESSSTGIDAPSWRNVNNNTTDEVNTILASTFTTSVKVNN